MDIEYTNKNTFTEVNDLNPSSTLRRDLCSHDRSSIIRAQVIYVLYNEPQCLVCGVKCAAAEAERETLLLSYMWRRTLSSSLSYGVCVCVCVCVCVFTVSLCF